MASFLGFVVSYHPRLHVNRGAELLTSIHRKVAQLLLDAEQLIVLGHAVGAAGSAGLDLAGVQGHGMSAMVASSVSPERWDTMAV